MAESLTPSKPRERALTKTETKTRLAALTAPVTVPVLLPLALPAPYDYLVPEGMVLGATPFCGPWFHAPID